MSMKERMERVYREARRITVGNEKKLVLISDCHRSIGSGADDFAKNQNLYYAALEHYLRHGFHYIELGDGDELWETKSFSYIAAEYSHVFELLAKLYQQGRYHMLWGNHDMVKKNARWMRRNMDSRLCERKDQQVPLFPGMRAEEAMVLELPSCEGELLLLHGHQMDFLNYDLWVVSKYLVRYVWRPMELIGIQDPFRPTRNTKRRSLVEQRLAGWAQGQGVPVVAGHTHRAAFPKPGQPPYFNDGCCVHPRHISAIEIENCAISLVHWHITTGRGGVLLVAREVEEGPVSLKEYFGSSREGNP